MQDPQENQKFSVQELAKAIREKYPEQSEMSDEALVNILIDQHPDYAEKVDFGEPSKKKVDTESPSTGVEENTKSYPYKSREDFIKQYRLSTGVSKEDMSDVNIAYNAAKLYPELKEMLGVKTEAYQVDWDELSKKARTKKRTLVADDSESQNAFKIIDEGDASDFLSGTHVGKIYNRAIASSEIGKITARSFYGGSIDFDELAYYSEVLEKNAGENWMSSFGETAVGGFLADLMRTIPESFVSLIDSSLSPEAVTAAAVTGTAAAAAGTIFAPVTGAAGAVSGAAFAGSSMLTFGSTLLQKLSEQGVDISDPKELETAWNNKDLLIPLAKESWAKAGMVGAFDAVSAGLGGTISKTAVKSGMKAARAQALEYGVEGSLGAAGEAFGSLAAGDEISGRDVLLEWVADPAAGVLGKGGKSLGKTLKATLGENADPDEVAITDRLEKDQERTLKEFKMSRLENAETLSKNKTQIKELEGALEAAPMEQKKIIKKEIDRLLKENTKTHRETLDSYDDYTSEEIEDMSTDADEIIILVRGMEASDMSESQKQAVTQIVENKAKALEAKKKQKKKPKKGINVSATDRGTGAPIKVTPEIEEQFLEPDAAQGFEEFMDTEETTTDAEFDQLIEEEAPKLVQKRKDNKGRDIKTFSNSKEEQGVKKTEYYSEREGEKIPTGGVVFSEKSTSNFDDLLNNFNIPKDEFTQAVGEDAEAVALVASETDGKTGKIDLVVKKPEGTIELSLPFTETPVEAAPMPKKTKKAAKKKAKVEEEVDESLSQEGKETVSQLAEGLDAVLKGLKSKKPEEFTDEEIAQANEALTAAMGSPSAPAMEGPPPSAYEDAFEAAEMESEDAEMLDAYMRGETKEVVLPLNYIKNVSDAVNNPTINLKFDEKSGWQVTKTKKGKVGDTASTKEALDATKKKVNRSLTKHFEEALTDPKSLTQFLAENAMEGDEFTVDNALYRVGKVTENKETANSYRDGVTFRNLKKFSGKTNVKDAVDVLYQKVFKKTATPQEEAILDDFERGRFKGVKDSKASIDDIVSLLDVLYITKKDGKAAFKQANAMARDSKTRKELSALTKKLKDEYGVLENDRLDMSGVPAETRATYGNLVRRVGEINKMTEFVKKVKSGKFKEIKEGGSIVKYMSERGIETSAGNGVTRTVKFQRYSRKTGEAIPTLQSGKQKEVISKRKTDFREYKEEQYTATIKDGVVRRKAINSERITKIFGEKAKASYTRFKESSEAAKAEKIIGAEYRRSKETRGKASATFSEGKSINALLLRPKSKSTLVSSIEKVFGLHKDKAEAASEISHRLIQNMARRAGVKPSEIYDRITFVKNEYKGDVRNAEDLTSPRALKTILRRFGAPISESNLDENGNPINFNKLDQKATPVTTDFKKYKQKGVEDSFTAQMIEDLKNLGINIMSKKGSALDNISEISSDKYASEIRRALAAPVWENKLIDEKVAVEMPYIQRLVKNNIAAYLRIPVEELNEEMLDLYSLRTGQKNPIKNEAKNYVVSVRGQQNDRAASWLTWLDSKGKALKENPNQENLAAYSRAFALTKTVLNFNYTSFNNPNNKLVKRTSTSVDNLTPFSKLASERWLESDDINPIVGYTNVLTSLSEETTKNRVSKKNSDGTYWVKYKTINGLGYNDSQAEVDALTYAASQTSWCTASVAERHLRGGDFHILFDKNNTPLTAIRMENGKIAEERGNTPDQGLIERYNNHLIEYKEGGFVEGYDSTTDVSKLQSEIAEARKGEWDNKKFDLYLKDIADSANPEETLEFYKNKNDDTNFPYTPFADVVILEDGVFEFGEEIFNSIVIVPIGRKAVVSSETTGVMRIKDLIVSDGSIEFKGFDDIVIDNVSESVSSLEYSANGYYPQIIVRDNRFRESSQYGDVTKVGINNGQAAIAFEEGIGAVEVVEGRDAWITEVAFADNNKKDGNRFRSLADIPDARVRRQVIVYGPEIFDREGYFDGMAYDATWNDGARILNQEIESQLNKEEFIKEHLTGIVDGDLNRFKTKKAANEFIKKHKKDNPALKFNPIKKSMGVDAGMWFINIQRNPKYKIQRKTDTTVRAQIALVDGQAVIFALTNPNVSSVVHEMSHMYEEYLTPQEVKVLEKWSGAKHRTENFSETFARGFERFLADGKAPTPELKSIFSQFKEWMKNIYKAIVGSPIEKDITPEVREIFENMVMIEGDVNFREDNFKTGDIVGPLKGKRKLNQEDAKSAMDIFEEVNTNSKKKVAIGNETKNPQGLWGQFKKAFSDRQSTIRKYMQDRGLVLAESTMNARAGAGARAKWKVEPIAEKIYKDLSARQEDILNMYLQAERIIQIEQNREAKRGYALEKINEFKRKRDVLLDAIKGKEYSQKDQKVIKESLDKIDGFIARAEKLYESNRLYKVDKNGIETGELAFKHPNGLTREDAEAAILTMSKREDFAVIKKRGELYFDAMSEQLKDLYQAGIINESTYNRFKNDKYISRAFLSHIFNYQLDSEGMVIKTHFEDNADFYKSIGLGSDQIKSLAEGSEGEIIMNSRYLLEKAYQSTSARVLKNESAKALAKEMKGKNTTWYKEGIYKEENGSIKEDRFGNYEPLSYPDVGFETVAYRENGMLRAFYLEKEAFNEWNDTELKLANGFGMKTLKMLSGTSILKAAATGANPLFFLVNVPMDMAHVLFFTDVYDRGKFLPVNLAKMSSKVAKNVSGILGLDIDSSNVINLNRDTKNTRRTKELLDIYFQNGGGMDFMTQQGQQLFDDKGNMVTKKNIKQKAVKTLGYTGNVTELAMRLATVEQVIENLNNDRAKGKNNLSDKEIHQIATAKARATMDFAQGGITTKRADQFVPYLNAATQAFRVTREYLSTAKGRANFANKWSQASIGVAMITFYNLLMSESDEDDDTLYDDIPDYIKDNYFIIIPPFQKRDADGKVNYIRIRKSPNVAPFINMSEAIARATYYSLKGIDDPRKTNNTKAQFKRAQEQISTALPFLPTGGGVVSKMPPTAQAALKYMANYDPFRQMNIVPENEFKKIAPSREGLGDERVPVFLKAFGEATGFSPKRSQAVIESYVTSPTTNLIVGGAYSILDKASNVVAKADKSKQSKYSDTFLKSIFSSGMGRVVRQTNPNWRNYTYNEAEKIKQEEGGINHEIKIQIAFYSKEYRDAKTDEQKKIAIEEYKEFVSTLKIPADRKRATLNFRERVTRDWSKVKNVDEGLSIKYAGDPEAGAKIFDLYFGVPDLRTQKGINEINERLVYLKKNFGYKGSKRFKNELYRISKEKYKY